MKHFIAHRPVMPLPPRLTRYWNAPLRSFYTQPAHRFFCYAMVTLLTGLFTFVALEVYAILAPYNATSLSFQAIYAWQTGLNFGICLFLVDMCCHHWFRDWGSYGRRTVGRNWSIWFGAYVVGFIVERTLIFWSISMYRPQIAEHFRQFPDLRPDFWSSFSYCFPFWLTVSFLLINFAQRQASKANANKVSLKTEHGDRADAIRLKLGRTIQYLRCESISHISVEDHYSRIHIQGVDGSKEIFRKMSLKEMMAMLPKDRFFQIHRSHAINLAFVTGFRKKGRSYEVVLKNVPETLPVSRQRAPLLKPILAQFLI